MFYSVNIDDLQLENSTYNINLIIDAIDESKGNKDIMNTTVITWKLKLYYFPTNEAPYYSTELKSVTVYLGQIYEFNTGPATNDTVNVKVTIDNPKFFLFSKYQIDEKTFQVNFYINATDPQTLGAYGITIKLIDEDRPSSKTT